MDAVMLEEVPTTELRRELARRYRVAFRAMEGREALESFVKHCAGVLEVPVARLVSRDRTQPLARLRQAAMVAVRAELGLSLKRVATEFGRKDHCTVIWAEKVVREDEKYGLRELVAEMRAGWKAKGTEGTEETEGGGE